MVGFLPRVPNYINDTIANIGCDKLGLRGKVIFY